MKIAVSICLACLSAVAVSSPSLAAESIFPADQDTLQSPLGTEARPYYGEHRLRAYDKTRGATMQGANCVTPKMVCWIGEPAAEGEACSCETRRFEIIDGLVRG
jgi:hypothetical protein